jgi:sugar phosphate isomerase/epimerase
MAYLTAHRCGAPEAVRVAAATGYNFVGLRLWPNVPGTPYQHLLGDAALMRETLAACRDTGVGVFDLEIVRIGEGFDPRLYLPLFEAGAELGARAVLVVGDDTDLARLATSYARLCEQMAPFGLTADLEFMPWTAVPDARSALALVEAAGNPANAGILVDALHFGRSNTTLDDIRAIPRRLLHYAQICDGEAGTHFSTEQLLHTARCERLMPGQGSIDLSGLFAALPPDLPVSVEVVHLLREAVTPAQAWAAECLAASRPFL